MAPLTGMHPQLRSQGCVFGLDRKSFGYKIRNKAPLNAFTSESEFVRGHNKNVPPAAPVKKAIRKELSGGKKLRNARSLIASCLVDIGVVVVVVVVHCGP